MRLRYFVLPLAVLLAGGCITEGNFDKKLSGTFCKKYQECNPDQFDAEYDSVGDCKNRNTDQFSDSDSDYSDCLKDAGCRFDSSQAGACRSAISDTSCNELSDGDWISECAEIYDCSDASDSDVANCFIAD